ncbi:putative membrane protein [Neolecta irregularis DAH-3]|uniref:Putative membrane protein n=1 Tax=Neolecta irregularis (strain DAH-3) TaxID=1198029 RepID=A0A1U7LKM3_NEOID|nr:putative membrane protein [Neolecta irregularis DAH-3]|eukprot:OLL23205.1 putative membrane protein [Neolecta irregularis DAH-3]
MTLTYVPLAILLLVGIKVVFVGRYNPWTGTTDLVRFSTNAGVDTHALRLLTPGISDVLFYLQFATIMGMLSLDYPEFYQPVLSRTSWSDFMFNTTHRSDLILGTSSGIITVANNTEYGLTRYASLVGLEPKEVFPWFMVWWLVLVGIVTFITEIGVLGKSVWAYSRGGYDQDLQRKHFPFLKGNTNFSRYLC